MSRPRQSRSVALVTAAVLVAGMLAGIPSAQAVGCTPAPAAEPGFTPLWDGTSEPTASGWTQSGPGGFDVVADDDGCSLLSRGGLGLLWYSSRTFGDYVLRLQFRTTDDTDNSGVFVRFPSAGGNTHNTAISQGYEVQIREGTTGDGEDQKTGSIYNQQRELRRNARPAGEWNDYEITVSTPQGPAGPLPVRISVSLNGEVVNVFQSTAANRGAGAGFIGLQNHGDNDAVSFRNIRLRNLTDTQAPTTSHSLDTSATQLPSGWYDGPVDVALHATDELGGSGLARTEYRVDGGDWQPYGNTEEVIFDGTQASFDRWRQAPSGSFQLLPDGSIHSVGGLGMLWYPEAEYGDMALRFEWRDVRPTATGSSNGGVFVRFPDIDEAVERAPEDRWPCQTGSAETNPAWVAINCGQEIQIYDGTSGEQQKTGSVYNFAPLTLEQARPNTQGEWNSYEVRTVGGGDYTVTVIRNGEVINTWTNTPGQTSVRDGDAPTDLRQFASGYVGLQNHGYPDHIQIRNVRVQPLGDPAPIRLAEPGAHTVEYRSTDGAGNTEQTRSVAVNIDPGPPVTVAEVQQDGSGPATVTLRSSDTGSGLARTEYAIDDGEWLRYGSDPVPILDHTPESFAAWRQAGPGSFQRQADGSIVSTGGLGMLWYPAQQYGDASLRFEWRDVRTDGGASNSGVFLRFPDPEEAVTRDEASRHSCQTGSAETSPAWVAIYCGHEFQIYDGASGEAQKTGSVYNFQPLDLDQADPTPPGTWNTYEIRTVGGGDYTATILRNDKVINTFVNAPGKTSSRSGDPGTDARQFARGYIGLQNHGSADRVQIRNVTVQDLSAEAAAFTVSAPGTHTVQFRSIDVAGHVEEVRQVTFTVS